MDDGSTATPRHPLEACADRIESALRAVADTNPGFLTTTEKRGLLTRLTGLSGRLESLRWRLLAVADDVAEAEGARDAAAWLTGHTRTAAGANLRDLRLARDLDTTWTRVAAALGAGGVNPDQARVIVRALHRLGEPVLTPDGQRLTVPADVLAQAEAKLVELAADYGPRELAGFGTKILEVVAPALFEEHERRLLEQAERRAEAATRLTLTTRGDGSTDLRARIPDAVATRLRTYLDALTSPRHQAMTNRADDDGPGDGPDHGAGGGAGGGFREPTSVLDPATGKRLPGDRVRGIAFCSLLESIDPHRLPLHGGAATTLVVTIDFARLKAGLGAGALADGTPITAGQARRLACQAQILPAVLGGRSEVLDLGRVSRFFTTAQRRALALDQPTCRAEHCTVPATWCEAHHHRRPWADGGTTHLADGKLLCGWHHHRAHDDTYLVKYLPNGDVRFHKRR